MLRTRLSTSKRRKEKSKSFTYKSTEQRNSITHDYTGEISNFFDDCPTANNGQCKSPIAITEISYLRAGLPTIPPKMLACLFLKFDGNSREVIEYLHRRDWDCILDIKKVVSSGCDIHFLAKYYQGYLPRGYQDEIFSEKRPGAYATYYKNISDRYQYYLTYCNSSSNWVEKPISSPCVPIKILERLNLDYPLLRTTIVNISFIPGLINF